MPDSFHNTHNLQRIVMSNSL